MGRAARLSRSTRAGSPMRRTDAARRPRAHPMNSAKRGERGQNVQELWRTKGHMRLGQPPEPGVGEDQLHR